MVKTKAQSQLCRIESNVMNICSEFTKRKEIALFKDLDTAFSGYERLIRQVNLIKAWTVTIMVACVGFLVSGKAISTSSVLLPAFATLMGFLILELRERSSMSFNKLEVLNIQRILMIEDKRQYEKELREYEFRDLRLNKLERADKIKHFISSAKNVQVFFWYIFWVTVILLAFVVTKA